MLFRSVQGNQVLKGSYYDDNNYASQRDDSMLNQGATRIDMRSAAQQEPTRRANEDVGNMVKDIYMQKALTGSEEYAPPQSQPEDRIKQGMNEMKEQIKKVELP